MRDFFEHQHQARKKTGRLVILFGLAVAGIIALTYIVVAWAYIYLAGHVPADHYEAATAAPSFWQPQLLAIIAPAVILLVGGASAYRLSQLSSGGSAVADSLGARPISPDTKDFDERKVLNVVEEMAIASGVPVPPVYVIDSYSINAFAAGYKPEDAVIGVTRGCVMQLSRDELQGVIAHEFSHILNGDMRLNLRLVGILFGILVIGLIGQAVVRGMFYGSAVTRSRNSKDRGGAVLVLLAVGVALIVIGFIGVAIGNIIKAAISRQREYLADASAVQFTRNPDGISGALKKIGGLSIGSRISAARADEFSHMYFGEGVRHYMGSLGSTHPPLDQRIKRVDPSWDGTFPEVAEPKELIDKRRRYQEQITSPKSRPQPIGFAPDASTLAAEAVAHTAVHDIGRPSAAHVGLARKLISGMPEALRDATHEPYSARAAIYAMLIDDDPQIADQQLAALSERGGDQIAKLTRSLLPAVRQLDDRARLPMIDMAVASLRRLSPQQFQAFDRDINQLIQADEKITFFEWILGRVLRRHLSPTFEGHRSTRPKYYAMRAVADDLVIVLSALAWAGADNQQEAEHALRVASRSAGLGHQIDLLPTKACGLSAVDQALTKLDEVAPAVKRNVMIACTTAIAADTEVTIREGELLRAVADSIGVPMPPILPGQKLM